MNLRSETKIWKPGADLKMKNLEMRSWIPGLDLKKTCLKPGKGHFLVYFNKSISSMSAQCLPKVCPMSAQCLPNVCPMSPISAQCPICLLNVLDICPMSHMFVQCSQFLPNVLRGQISDFFRYVLIKCKPRDFFLCLEFLCVAPKRLPGFWFFQLQWMPIIHFMWKQLRPMRAHFWHLIF